MAKAGDDGMKGKAVNVLHVVGDYLWAAGDQKDPSVVYILTPREDPLKGSKGKEKIKEGLELEGDSGGPEEEDVAQRLDSASLQEDEGAGSDDEEKGGSTQGSEGVEGDAGISEAKMDELFEHAFVHAVRELVQDSDLPLLLSTLYSAYMQDLRPMGITLDIKRTSYKKVG